MELNEVEKLILKLLYKADCKIKGNTMFQKIMYILKSEYQDRIHELKSLQFKLHYYGPFSRDVENMLIRLVLRGLLIREVEPVIDYLRYNYILSEKGREKAKELYHSENRREVIDAMANKVRELNEKPLQEVISKAYRIAERNGL